MSDPVRADRDVPGEVPLFGTWRAIYGAVIATAVLVMVLVAVFSGWPY